jgi:polar amino acid transport system permease protein
MSSTPEERTSTARASGAATRIVSLPIGRRLHIGSWILAALAVLFGGWIAWKVSTNHALHWDVVGHYLFASAILQGVKRTILITLLAMSIGIVGGLFVALLRTSSNPVLRFLSGIYIWGFRGVPVLVQLIIWFNLGLVFEHIQLDVPFTSIQIFSWNTNSVITPFSAAILGLGLNEIAYDAEIIRGGLNAVPPGQREAAMSLGMVPHQILRKITIPQVARVITPTLSNQLIIMLKISSLASLVTYEELTTTVQNIYATNLRTVELLIVASIWYVALTTLCTIGQGMLERRLGRSSVRLRTAKPRVWSRLLGMDARA